jgi:RimJ/RimL family protein N-acetyltransferase
MKTTLKTSRLELKEVSLSDAINIHALHSLKEIDRYNTLGLPENIEQTNSLVSEWVESQNEIQRKRYIFCVEFENKFIGLAGINIGKPGYASAEIWYKIHPQYWSQGFATELVNGVLQFLFDDLKLHRVEAGCATNNLASIRVLEKAGLQKEGLKRKILPIRGEWVDNYMYAILEQDYKP